MRLRHGSFLLSITHSFRGLYAGCNSFFRIYESLPLELKTVQLCLTRTDSLKDYFLETASTGLRMRLTTCAEETSKWQDQNKADQFKEKRNEKQGNISAKLPPSSPLRFSRGMLLQNGSYSILSFISFVCPFLLCIRMKCQSIGVRFNGTKNDLEFQTLKKTVKVR